VQGAAGLGRIWQVRCGAVRIGASGNGVVRQLCYGKVCQGPLGLGRVRQFWHGLVRCVRVCNGSAGMKRSGVVGRVEVRQASSGRTAMVSQGRAW
jgi:hypothetical protein